MTFTRVTLENGHQISLEEDAFEQILELLMLSNPRPQDINFESITIDGARIVLDLSHVSCFLLITPEVREKNLANQILFQREAQQFQAAHPSLSIQ